MQVQRAREFLHNEHAEGGAAAAAAAAAPRDERLERPGDAGANAAVARLEVRPAERHLRLAPLRRGGRAGARGEGKRGDGLAAFVPRDSARAVAHHAVRRRRQRELRARDDVERAVLRERARFARRRRRVAVVVAAAAVAAAAPPPRQQRVERPRISLRAVRVIEDELRLEHEGECAAGFAPRVHPQRAVRRANECAARQPRREARATFAREQLQERAQVIDARCIDGARAAAEARACRGVLTARVECERRAHRCRVRIRIQGAVDKLRQANAHGAGEAAHDMLPARIIDARRRVRAIRPRPQGRSTWHLAAQPRGAPLALPPLPLRHAELELAYGRCAHQLAHDARREAIVDRDGRPQLAWQGLLDREREVRERAAAPQRAQQELLGERAARCGVQQDLQHFATRRRRASRSF